MQFYYGNYEAFKAYFVNQTVFPIPELFIWWNFMIRTKMEYTSVTLFSSAIIKSIVYPIAFLMQILCLIYLIRGSSGYSRSARNWFIMAVSADIASFIYLLYELLVQDWISANPFNDKPTEPAVKFMALMWGLRDASHAAIQNIMCKAFFSIVYFPIYLSPIALTMSSLLRSYSVKNPLRAKSVLTKFTDRALMLFAVILALAVSVIISVITTKGESTTKEKRNILGTEVFVATCHIPQAQMTSNTGALLQAGYFFMMTFGFLISGLNLVSAVITIWVLFDARRTRKSMTSSTTENSNSEIRATMKLLAINIVIFICFFLSRLFIVLQYLPQPSLDYNIGADYIFIIRPMIFERLGSYPFVIPYCINWLFIVGFDAKFYGYFFKCGIKKSEDSGASTQVKTV